MDEYPVWYWILLIIVGIYLYIREHGAPKE